MVAEDKILLGIPDKKNKECELVLENFEIHLDGHALLSRRGILFYNMTSPALRQRLPICFGSYSPDYFEGNFDENGDILESSEYYNCPDSKMLALIQNNRKLLLEEAAYWIAAIRCLANVMDEIWMLRMSHVPGYVEWPLIEVGLDELQAEHLLKLRGDQAIVIRKWE